MEECLAIKPDLIFLWDEAWFGFARFSPLYRPRTAMGARADLKEAFADPGVPGALPCAGEDARRGPRPQGRARARHPAHAGSAQGQAARLPDELDAQVDVRAAAGLDGRWWPTRTTTSTSRPFKEAVFTHASTSPNQQIIASLDVARRQMELEGYGLVDAGRSSSRSRFARAVNTHPLVSKYFRVLDVEDMIPAEFRQSGLKSYIGDGVTWADAARAFREDEFILDPTRLTLLCGTAGYDGTQFKNLLAAEYEIQLNKTSRNCDPAADQHQQHAQRRGEPAQGARRDLQGDRGASQERRRGGARRPSRRG